MQAITVDGRRVSVQGDADTRRFVLRDEPGHVAQVLGGTGRRVEAELAAAGRRPRELPWRT